MWLTLQLPVLDVEIILREAVPDPLVERRSFRTADLVITEL